MGYPIYHSICGSGSTQYKYPSSVIAGNAPNGANPNVYAERMTGQAVYIVNSEDTTNLSGPIKTTKVVVTTAATPLPSGGNMSRRRAIAIANEGSSTLYIGHGSGVAANEGFPIASGGSISINLLAHHTIWGRTASGTSEVRILEIM